MSHTLDIFCCLKAIGFSYDIRNSEFSEANLTVFGYQNIHIGGGMILAPAKHFRCRAYVLNLERKSGYHKSIDMHMWHMICRHVVAPFKWFIGPKFYHAYWIKSHSSVYGQFDTFTFFHLPHRSYQQENHFLINIITIRFQLVLAMLKMLNLMKPVWWSWLIQNTDSSIMFYSSFKQWWAF